MHSGKNLPKTLHLKKMKFLCTQGLKSLNVPFRTCPSKPKTFIRAIIDFPLKFLACCGSFQVKNQCFRHIKSSRSWTECVSSWGTNQARNPWKSSRKCRSFISPQVISLKLILASVQLKITFFFSNVVFFEVFSHCEMFLVLIWRVVGVWCQLSGLGSRDCCRGLETLYLVDFVEG